MVPGEPPFASVSDAGGKIGEVYGVYDEEAGVDIRGRFLIDLDGIIQAMEVMTPPVGRNFAELLRQVMAFQHVRARKRAFSRSCLYKEGPLSFYDPRELCRMNFLEKSLGLKLISW
jgi:alkyl hydroperoxide reductase subunit AhpC